MNKTIAASILGIENKKEIINKLISKNIKWIHYDLMDGKFVDNISLSVDEISSLVKTTKKHVVDVHLMVEKPYDYIAKLYPISDYISFHFEAVSESEIKSILNDFNDKTKLGIVLNPQTKIEEVLPFLDQFNFVLIMSVVAGKGGQSFMPEVLEKVKKIKSIYPHKLIEIDGGINDETSAKSFTSGADVAVSGSFLIKNLDNKEVLEKML